MSNSLSRITIGEPFVGVEDELPDVHLFHLDAEVDWHDEMLMFLESGSFLKYMNKYHHLTLHTYTYMVIAG